MSAGWHISWVLTENQYHLILQRLFQILDWKLILLATWLAGADPGFLLGGVALVSCSTSTPINHIVFFCRIPVVLENRRSSRGVGVRTPCTLPLDPPLTSLVIHIALSQFVGTLTTHHLACLAGIQRWGERGFWVWEKCWECARREGPPCAPLAFLSCQRLAMQAGITSRSQLWTLHYTDCFYLSDVSSILGQRTECAYLIYRLFTRPRSTLPSGTGGVLLCLCLVFEQLPSSWH